jgi:hypothetical protein
MDTSRLFGAVCSCALYCVIGYSSQAISASLNFDLIHDGGASSIVVDGSEDPLLHSFNIGDHIVYRVTAVDNGYWKVNNTFRFSAGLTVLDGGARTGNWSVDFLLYGNSVISNSLNNIKSLLSIGALVTLTAETMFDEIVMTYDLLDSTASTNFIQSREFITSISQDQADGNLTYISNVKPPVDEKRRRYLPYLPLLLD